MADAHRRQGAPRPGGCDRGGGKTVQIPNTVFDRGPPSTRKCRKTNRLVDVGEFYTSRPGSGSPRAVPPLTVTYRELRRPFPRPVVPRVGRGSPDRRCGSGPRTPPPAWRSASGRRGARRMDRVEVAVLQPVTHTKHAGDRQDRLHPRGSRLSDRAALLGLVAPEGRAPMNQVVQGHREEKRSLLYSSPRQTDHPRHGDAAGSHPPVGCHHPRRWATRGKLAMITGIFPPPRRRARRA